MTKDKITFPIKSGDLIRYKTNDDYEDKNLFYIRNRIVGNDMEIKNLFANAATIPIIGLVTKISNLGTMKDSQLEKQFLIWEMQLLIGEKEYGSYCTIEEAEEWFEIIKP